jgi:hypothetical protein
VNNHDMRKTPLVCPKNYRLTRSDYVISNVRNHECSNTYFGAKILEIGEEPAKAGLQLRLLSELGSDATRPCEACGHAGRTKAPQITMI